MFVTLIHFSSVQEASAPSRYRGAPSQSLGRGDSPCLDEARNLFRDHYLLQDNEARTSTWSWLPCSTSLSGDFRSSTTRRGTGGSPTTDFSHACHLSRVDV